MYPPVRDIFLRAGFGTLRTPSDFPHSIADSCNNVQVSSA